MVTLVRPAVRARLIAGAVAPPLFVCVLASLTVIEWGFLRRVEWSAVHRTKVEWPSLLALGHFGWVMIAEFVVTGICGMALASAIWETARGMSERVEAVLVGVVSIAIGLEAFGPDSPLATGPASWHDSIHNSVFPAIPVASLGAAAAAVLAARNVPEAAIGARAAALLLGLMVVSLALTGVDEIAQLARYLYFGALLVWIELLALGMLVRERQSSSSRAIASQEST